MQVNHWSFIQWPCFLFSVLSINPLSIDFDPRFLSMLKHWLTFGIKIDHLNFHGKWHVKIRSCFIANTRIKTHMTSFQSPFHLMIILWFKWCDILSLPSTIETTLSHLGTILIFLSYKVIHVSCLPGYKLSCVIKYCCDFDLKFKKKHVDDIILALISVQN